MSDNNTELKSLKFKRSIKSKLGSGLSKLGSSSGGAKTTILFSIFFAVFVYFSNYHMIYLKTGTPMLKYGLAMTFLQPFYSMYAMYIVFAKYALKQSVKASALMR